MTVCVCVCVLFGGAVCFDYFLLEGRRFKGEEVVSVVSVVRGARGGEMGC